MVSRDIVSVMAAETSFPVLASSGNSRDDSEKYIS